MLDDTKLASLLWVDDDGVLEESLRPLREKTDVEVFLDPIEALARISDIDSSLIVVDLLMPKLTGSELIQEILQLRPTAKIIVYSSFFDMEEVSDFPLFDENGIDVFDKNAVSLKELVELIAAKYLGEDEDQVDDLSVDVRKRPQGSVLDEDFVTYIHHSERSRYLLVKSAKVALAERLKAAFDNGVVWYLYLGKDEPPLLAKKFEEIPTRKEVRALCEKADVPVFQFVRSGEIDDLTWNANCCESTQNYPLVGLQPDGKDEVLPVHFDTGSHASFADIDVLKRFSVDLEDLTDADFTPYELASGDFPVLIEPVFLTVVDGGGQKAKVHISFVVPKHWSQFKNRERLCTASCNRNDTEDHPLSNYGQHGNPEDIRHYCKYRWGLVGRNLVLETDLSLVLDGKAKLLRFFEGD